MTKVSFEAQNCNIPTECSIIRQKIRHVSTNKKCIRCLLNDGSRLTFNKSIENIAKNACKKLETNDINDFYLRPKKEGSIKLDKEMIDLKGLIGFVWINNYTFINIYIQFFNGFDLDLYDDSIDMDNGLDLEYYLYILKMRSKFILEFSSLNFYLGEKKITTCEELIETRSNTKSIFQIASRLTNNLGLFLAEYKNKMCPLLFKNTYILKLVIVGEKSFYSNKILSFSNHTIKDLKATIKTLEIYVNNIELNTDLLHPDVFNKVMLMKVFTKVNKIHPYLFLELYKVAQIHLQNVYLRSLMHNSGIEWIKNINKNISCNLENLDQSIEYMRLLKFIILECFNNPGSPPLVDIFPDEDFCLYNEYPINQMVVISESCRELQLAPGKISCTYLWITRSYKYFANIFESGSIERIMMERILNSSDYKSISECNFEKNRNCAINRTSCQSILSQALRLVKQ